MSTSQTTHNEPQHSRTASEWVLAFFTSPLFMMLALGLALLAQGKHTADVFAFWSHQGTPEWLFYAFAGGVEIAVFIFVLHDHKRTSYAFAVGAFATNVVYYAIGGANLLSAELFPVVLLSVLLPGVIVGYSHTIAEKPKTDTPAPAKASAKVNTRRWWHRLLFWKKPTEAPATNIQPIKPAKAPVALPAGTLGHSDASPAPTAPAAEAADQPPAAAAGRRLTEAEKQTIINMSSNGMKGAAIAKALDLNENTVRSTIARASKPAVHHNGIAKEPAL